MTKSAKKLKKIEKQFAKALDKSFGGLKDWMFIGDMHKGYLAIVITAKEK